MAIAHTILVAVAHMIVVAFAHMFSTELAGLSAAAVVGVTPLPRSADDCFEELGDCSNPAVPIAGEIPWIAIVIGAVFLAVLVLGLRAIKRQRDEGRRSKLPPIG